MGNTDLVRAEPCEDAWAPLKIVRPPTRIDAERVALFIGAALPTSLGLSLLYGVLYGLAGITSGALIAGVLMEIHKVYQLGSEQAAVQVGWFIATCALLFGLWHGFAVGVQAFLESNPLVVAPEGALRNHDWNRTLRVVSAALGLGIIASSIVAGCVSYSLATSKGDQDNPSAFKVAFVLGVGVAALGQILFAPRNDAPSSTQTPDKPGYRTILIFDREDFAQRAGDLSEAEVAQAMSMELGATSCETWWSEKIKSQVMVFRWTSPPPPAIQKRLAQVPPEYAYGRELKLLYYGSAEGRGSGF